METFVFDEETGNVVNKDTGETKHGEVQLSIDFPDSKKNKEKIKEVFEDWKIDNQDQLYANRWTDPDWEEHEEPYRNR